MSILSLKIECTKIFLPIFTIISDNSFKHDVVRHHRDGTPYIIGADTRDYFFKPFWRLEIGFTLFYNLEVLFKVCKNFYCYLRKKLMFCNDGTDISFSVALICVL